MPAAAASVSVVCGSPGCARNGAIELFAQQVEQPRAAVACGQRQDRGAGQPFRLGPGDLDRRDAQHASAAPGRIRHQPTAVLHQPIAAVDRHTRRARESWPSRPRAPYGACRHDAGASFRRSPAWRRRDRRAARLHHVRRHVADDQRHRCRIERVEHGPRLRRSVVACCGNLGSPTSIKGRAKAAALHDVDCGRALTSLPLFPSRQLMDIERFLGDRRSGPPPVAG